MKRLKINGLEINRFNDKSVGKWNKDDILLTNKNPLIPVTIPSIKYFLFIYFTYFLITTTARAARLLAEVWLPHK